MSGTADPTRWTLAGKRILITGGSGYVGRAVAAHLRRRNTVFSLQRSPAADPLPGVHYVVGDVTRLTPSDLPGNLDIIIHQAAMLDNPIVGPEPPNRDLFRTNVQGTQNMLELALEAGVPTFVHGSTAGLYGLGPEPFPETAPFRPLNFYQLSKCMTELMAEWYGRSLSVISLRYSAPYGPGTSNPLLKYLADQVRAGNPVRCPADGGARFNPIYIDDAVAVTERACLLRGYHAMNVAGPEITSRRDVAERLAAIMSIRVNLVLEPGPPSAQAVVDTRQMQSTLEYACTVSLDQGLRALVSR